MKKSVSAILILFLISALIISCGGESQEKPVQQTETDAVAESAEEITELPGWKGSLERADYGGEKITVLVETNANTPIWERYWTSEEDSGDILSSSVYKRNLNVSEYYNIGLEYVFTESIGDRMYNSVMAGEYVYNYTIFHLASASSYILKGPYLNWFDMPNVDFGNPWWSDSNAEDLSYKNILYTAIGDYAVSSLATTYCMFFNTNLADSYGISGIYDTVRNGAWTIDTVKAITQDIYSDLNNNGKADADDLYGFVTPPATALIAYNWALGGQIFKKNSDGSLANVYMSDHTVQMFERLYSLLYESAGSYTSYDYKSPYGDAYHSMGRDYLLNGKAVFINGKFDDALTYFRSMDDDFGIIPYPKLNEEQKNYYTTCDANLEAMTIPVTTPAEKYGMIGLLAEALCAESHETVIPAYYQSSLKDKASRDEDSLEMLDLIHNSRRYDFGYLFNFGTSGTYYASFMQDLMNPKKPSSDIVSEYEKNSSKFEQYFQAIFDYYDEQAAD